MLVIRLFRTGKKHQPSFKIVVTDKRNPARGGRSVEEIGAYSPLTKKTVLKKERAQYWLSKGAKPSDTVYNLFLKEQVLSGKKIALHKKSKKQTESTPVQTPAPATPPTPTPTPESVTESAAEQTT